MPNAFQFNVEYLRYLADESYNCNYGTFLFNNPKEREAEKVSERTQSIWGFINSPFERSKFVN